MDYLDVRSRIWNNLMVQLPKKLVEWFSIFFSKFEIGEVLYRLFPSFNHYKLHYLFRPRVGHYPQRILMFLQRSW